MVAKDFCLVIFNREENPSWSLYHGSVVKLDYKDLPGQHKGGACEWNEQVSLQSTRNELGAEKSLP